MKAYWQRSAHRRLWRPFVQARAIPVRAARSDIFSMLGPLMARAKREKLWFWNPLQNLWLSPSQFMAHLKAGQYVWGPDNWRLRDPMEYTK